MTVSPAARPSSPSVRFTALELAVVTNVTNPRYTHHGSTSTMYLKKGSCVAEGSALLVSGNNSR